MIQQGTDADSEHIPDVRRPELIFRSLLIFVQIAAAYLLAQQVSPFFYQQF